MTTSKSHSRFLIHVLTIHGLYYLCVGVGGYAYFTTQKPEATKFETTSDAIKALAEWQRRNGAYNHTVRDGTLSVTQIVEVTTTTTNTETHELTLF